MAVLTLFASYRGFPIQHRAVAIWVGAKRIFLRAHHIEIFNANPHRSGGISKMLVFGASSYLRQWALLKRDFPYRERIDTRATDRLLGIIIDMWRA